MVNQIKKNSRDIKSFLSDIEGINLFLQPLPNQDGSLVQCKVSVKINHTHIIKL